MDANAQHAELAAFSAPTREWLRGAFEAPTAVQLAAWHAIRQQRHALVVAPTGSGKTLAAFLWAIDRLSREPGDESDESDESEQTPRRLTRILYLSPLKALGVDVQRNLRAPLIGITQTARRLGVDAGRITVGVRSGDTPAAERRALLREPPDILITTPESLYLMLSSQARRTLREVETVIVDEVHAVAGSKRGAHLALSLERLDALLPRPAQRIGLSATVRPLHEVARFLGGRAPVEIVAPPSSKRLALRVVVPVEDLSDIGVSRQGRSRGGDERAPDEGWRPGSAARSLRDPDEPGSGGAPATGSIWPHIEASILDEVLRHRSTIVFVNSRQLAERLTARLNELYEEQLGAPEERGSNHRPAVIVGGSGLAHGAPADLARAHHGSVSKEARAEVEEALKQGRLRCVVATSSLELGIDMGDVELVIQVESPPSVASGLQRLGRAGHQVGEVSRGLIYPKHRADVLHSAVAATRMLTGEIEQLHVIANPLDVLAQHTVAAAAVDEVEVEAWYDLVRRSAPFAGLSRGLFEATLDLVAGRYPSERFGELRPRLVWDRDRGVLQGRPGAQRVAVTSGGTIPDRGMFGVYLAAGDEESSPDADGTGAPAPGRGGRRVGELDEEMVYESRVGDVFALGTTSWRILEITHERVVVLPAHDQAGRLPFWVGDPQGRPAELGRAIGHTVRQVAAADAAGTPSLPPQLGEVLDARASSNLIAYIHEQRLSTGTVPSDAAIVVERFRDELGDWRVVLHSPYGRPVHAPWALLVSARVREQYGVEAGAVAGDDGIVVRVPEADAEPPGAELFALDEELLESQVTAQLGSSALFASRFREAAARALLLPRLAPGRRAPLWQQRQRAASLLEVAREYPSFPIILETVREVLHDVYDLDALRELARRIARREVQMVEAATESPSPFARTLLFGYVGAFMYEGDAPLAERRAAALSLDPQLLAELLGQVELRELLDAEVIARVERELQRLVPERRARGLEGAADLLRQLGPLSDEELAARLRGADDPGDDPLADAPSAQIETALALAEQLVAARRALRVRIAGVWRFAAIEDAARLRDALGVALPIGVPVAFIEPVADPVGDLVVRHARSHGPFTVAQFATRFGLGPAVVQQTFDRLAIGRQLVAGAFRPGEEAPEWVDAQVLRRIRARSLAALRSEVEPALQPAYARFLPAWQQVGAGLRGLDGVVAVIEQLAGVPLPASAWEQLVLPLRVDDYAPALLDELTTTGEVVWRGHGAIPGGDGWLSLHLAETAALTLPAAPGEEPDALGARILALLADGGARFAWQLLEQLNRPAPAGDDEPSAAIDEATLAQALWALAWGGHLSNDSLAPLRALLHGGGGRSAPAHRQQRRATRGRLARSRVAFTVADDQTQPQAPRGTLTARGRFTLPQLAGRWSLAPQSTLGETARAHAVGELLLDRYGVVTRGAVAAEGIPGGFALVYRLLRRFEEQGHARRGYFIEGLGAAQFATAGAVDRLRSFTLDPGDAPPRSALTLAATDPANPYGAALAWPPSEGHRPGRKPGGLVTLVDGVLALYVERGGRSLLSFSSEDAVLAAAAVSLAQTVRERLPELAVERIDGDFALGHPLADALQRAGFSPTPKGLRIRHAIEHRRPG